MLLFWLQMHSSAISELLSAEETFSKDVSSDLFLSEAFLLFPPPANLLTTSSTKSSKLTEFANRRQL